MAPKAIRAARWKQRKCQVINITKKVEKRQRHCRQLEESTEKATGQERGKTAENEGRDGILEAEEKLCGSLMA